MGLAHKKNGKQKIGCSRGGLATKIHMVTASDRAAVSFSLSSGNASDGPEGRKLLSLTSRDKAHRYLIMDRAYEGDQTRLLAINRDTFQLFLQNGIENSLGNITGNSISEEIRSNAFSCESSVFAKFSLAMTS